MDAKPHLLSDGRLGLSPAHKEVVSLYKVETVQLVFIFLLGRSKHY